MDEVFSYLGAKCGYFDKYVCPLCLKQVVTPLKCLKTSIIMKSTSDVYKNNGTMSFIIYIYIYLQ